MGLSDLDAMQTYINPTLVIVDQQDLEQKSRHKFTEIMQFFGAK